jgi:ubiquinone/menaquinone biosynthesis C-methylase UbiE
MPKRNIDYWEWLIKNAPPSYQKWFEEENKFLHKEISKNSKVLEVGCGDGRSLFTILDITKEVYGVDHDKKAIEHAKEKFKNVPKSEMVVGEADAIPYENDFFDYVICIGTFANFGSIKFKVLEEMKRVLKKEGKIIISVFSEDALSERLKVYKLIECPIKEVKDNGTVIFDESVGDNISEQFSKEQLEEIFERANLKINEIIKKGIGYFCLLSK